MYDSLHSGSCVAVLCSCLHRNTPTGCLASRLVHVVLFAYLLIYTDPPLASPHGDDYYLSGGPRLPKTEGQNTFSIIAAILRLGLISRFHGKGHKGTFVFETCFLISRLTDL